MLHEKSSRKASYGELVEAAEKLPLPDPEKVRLKDESKFELIGHATPRVDIPSKVNGSAQFGLDVRVPEMLFAVVARCPTFGGKPAHFDATKAKAVPGVRDVFEIPALGRDMFTAGGVVVVADSTWAAMKGRDALQITWDNGAAASESTRVLCTQPCAPQRESRANASATTAMWMQCPRSDKASRGGLRISLSRARHDGADEHHGSRARQGGRSVGADAVSRLGAANGGEDARTDRPKVIVHTTLMGGGFGRRYMADYPAEAAQIAKVVGKPVQLVWSPRR